MTSYVKQCIHCGEMISKDAKYCPKCKSRNPFIIRCPEYFREVTKDQKECSCCGRKLIVKCPFCGEMSFVLDQCEKCGTCFLIECFNKRCGEMVFFQNEYCTMCGRRLK